MPDSKNQCTFACSHAINKLFHIGRYFGQFIARYRAIYRPIFKYRSFFCCKRYGERFSHIVSAADKKGDIGRYLGRYLKQGLQNQITN